MDPRTRANRLILRGYGPLAGLVVVLLFLTMLVPSRPLSTVAVSGAADSPASPVPVATTAPGGTSAPLVLGAALLAIAILALGDKLRLRRLVGGGGG